MQEVTGRLIEQIQRTPSVVSFRFSLSEKVNFLPGQFAKILFDKENKNNRDLNKYLSFSSSPTKDYIEVTKRISDSQFSQRLKALKINDEVLLQGSFGKCVLKPEYTKIGFLIGGIGITPVISMLEYMTEKGLNIDVVLLYSNKTEQEIAFKAELDRWQTSNIQIVYTITACPPKDTNCIYSRINKELFLDKITDINERVFFIFGPPKMVEALKDVCLNSGGKEELLMTENFVGY